MEPMTETPTSSTEPQVLVPQVLFEEMQRQLQELQELQAAAAQQPPPSTIPPVTPPAPEHAATLVSHSTQLKPTRPTRYSGVKDYTTIENWIASVNSYFALTGAKPPQIYHYLNTNFTDEAAIWFRYNYHEEQAMAITWEDIRAALRNFFTPPNKDRRLHDEWAQLRQTTTVAEYVGRFYKLGMQLPAMESEHLLDKFLRGLKPKTRMELELKDPRTLAEAIRLADRFDSIVYRKTVSLSPSAASHNSIEYESGGEPMQLDAMRIKPKTSPQTPTLKKLTAEERTHLRNIGACFRCRKTGHISRECPSKSLKPPSGSSPTPGSSKNFNHQ